MSRFSRLCAVAALLLAALLLLPTSANAASGDVIRELRVEIEIRPDGLLDVTETYDWDFGTREGLGLTRELDARFDYDPDPDVVRVYEYGDFAVTSPTDAPAGVWPRRSGEQMIVDVGAPDGSDDRRSGRQAYVLTYTVGGALNAIRGQEGVADQDELYWNATGHGWRIPIERSAVTVRGPADVVDHACYQGSSGATAECDSLAVDGNEVAAASGRLDPGSGVTVMAAFPPGTFGDISPILEERAAPPWQVEESESVRAVGSFVRGNAAWLVPLGLATPVLFGVRRVRRGRDQHFADLPPGVLPAEGSTPRVETLTSTPPVAVRFTPPDDLRPGEVGALDAKGTSTTHVTATIIDLAVRGYLRLEEAGTNWLGKVNDWTLVATPEGVSREDLRGYERTLLQQIFRRRRQVKLSQLRNTFAGTLRQVRNQLGTGLHARGLVARPLRAAVRPAALLVLIPLSLFGAFALFMVYGVTTTIRGPSSGLLAVVAVVLVAALVMAAVLTRQSRYPRTAQGRALHEQSRSFELYLSTAEANQLRFEEGEDIFSRYLPYAIVYGVAERWADVFAELEARGVQVQRPTWYVGSHGFDAGGFRTLASSMSSFSSTAGTALSSTPGSSGSSGSRSGGGGGGFSGGGGGGGGGGGR